MKPEGIQQPEELISGIAEKLRQSHSLYRRRYLQAAMFICAGIWMLLLSVYILAESEWYLDSTIKTGWILFAFLVPAVSVATIYYNRKTESFNAFYSRFLESIHDKKLHSALDLYLGREEHSSLFYQSALQTNLEGFDRNTFSVSLKRFLNGTRPVIRFKKGLILFAGGFLALVSSASIYGGAFDRSVQFWADFERPNPYLFTVLPADTTIEQGSSVAPSILFHSGDVPRELYLAFKTDVEEEFRVRPVYPEPASSNSESIFRSDNLELTSDISYRFEMDGFLSETYRASVEMQPRFEQLTATVTPPAYTSLDQSQFSYPFSQVTAYYGSRIELQAIPNKAIESAEIRIQGEWTELEPTSLENAGAYTISLTPVDSDTLEFRLTDADGLRNTNRFRTVITMRDDIYPSVAILEPDEPVVTANPEQLLILFRASDDFGLTQAELRWDLSRAFVDEPLSGSLQLNRPGNGRTERFDWDLSDLELRPRDELTFRVRVWDNDGYNGAKWSESQTLTLSVPSLAEFFDELDSDERAVQEDLDVVSENFEQMETEYRELLEKLRQNPDGGFEEQRMMEEISERREEIEESVREMTNRFEQIRSELSRSDRISEETRQAYRELQQLMEELDNPALREAMEQMQQALENMSPQEIERALENMEFNEQLYKERLQRTAELFKRLKMNSDLDKLAARYEDLAERTAPREGQTLERLEEELETVDSDLGSLEEQLEELDSNPPRNAAESLRQLKEQSQSALEQIRNETRDLNREAAAQSEEQSGNSDAAPDESLQNRQQQLSESMRSESERFRSSMQQMSGQQMQVNIAALQQALYTLFDLSETQEHLTQSASETRSRSQGFVELAREQKNISDQFTIVADTLFAISSQIPGIPNRINQKKADVERELERSLDEMVERNQRGSSVTSREALGGMNDLTSMIASLIDQLMNMQGGGAGGGGMSMEQMAEQLQQMSGDQMRLNQQLQQMINDMQGDRLTREQSERLDQMARQQNEIRRQLRELQQRGALEPGDRALSDLQRMVEDMEESINDMRGGISDPIMVQRQQNILSRMLQTEQSLQQRGESEEREGTASNTYDRTLPPEMTLEELEQEIRSRLQDPNYTRFSEQYQRLIERYFELLRRQEQR
ncbi:DUF4175 family protein [Rhodohalobacter mucosus]|uniref:Uncharacterized protein n=1 Tax=Rhodohalobacter mucosus TaxID=2079485 RepID=A0A316U2C5_9BACT|nr:DUF4175 family protein [Rhodohalobacter mucosus]PWN07336.1 hypothetical protein DDZ15_03465 [Rhodohalobacter mucosus]